MNEINIELTNNEMSENKNDIVLDSNSLFHYEVTNRHNQTDYKYTDNVCIFFDNLVENNKYNTIRFYSDKKFVKENEERIDYNDRNSNYFLKHENEYYIRGYNVNEYDATYKREYTDNKVSPEIKKQPQPLSNRKHTFYNLKYIYPLDWKYLSDTFKSFFTEKTDSKNNPYYEINKENIDKYHQMQTKILDDEYKKKKYINDLLLVLDKNIIQKYNTISAGKLHKTRKNKKSKKIKKNHVKKRTRRI
jgi:hypothetical protein